MSNQKEARVIVIPPYGSDTYAHEETTSLDLHALRQLIGGGYLESVNLPEIERSDMVALVDEERHWKCLPVNYIGSIMYGCHRHGNRLYGTVVLIGTEWTKEGKDFCSLPPDVNLAWIRSYLNKELSAARTMALRTLGDLAMKEQDHKS